ncbi:GTPase activating protein (GAP) for Rho1p, partial [Spiromyces aspiralis]
MVSRTLLLDDLFGAPLEAAVLASGVKVGYFVGSGEPCVVPAIIAICGQHLVKNGQKTNGIFRISGSMKRVHRLQSEFKRDKEFGKNIDWYGYTMHDTATVFRRYLTKLPGSIIPIEFYERFRKVLRAESEAERNEKFSVLIYKLPVFQRHTLLYILHILNIFAKSENNTATLMDASNLAAVFQPSLLVHPDHIMKPEEYARSKDVVEYLISNVTSFYPPECLPKSSISVRALLSPGDRLSSLAAAQREIMMDGKYGVISDEPIIFHAQVGGDGGNSSSSNSGEAGVVSTFSARRVPARLYDPASASTIARRASLVLSGGRSPDNQPIDLLAAINYNYRSNRISKDWTVTGAPPRQSDVSQYVAPGGPPPRSPSSAGLVATQPSSSHSSIALAYNPAATDTVSQSLPSRLGSYATNSSSEAIYSRHKIPSRSVKNGTTSGGDHRTKPVSSPKPNQQATSAIPFSVEGRDGIQPDAG